MNFKAMFQKISNEAFSEKIKRKIDEAFFEEQFEILHSHLFDHRFMNLIAAYEEVFNIPEQNRIVLWSKDHCACDYKDGIPRNALEVCQNGLNALGVSARMYFCLVDYEFREDVIAAMCKRNKIPIPEHVRIKGLIMLYEAVFHVPEEDRLFCKQMIYGSSPMNLYYEEWRLRPWVTDEKVHEVYQKGLEALGATNNENIGFIGNPEFLDRAVLLFKNYLPVPDIQEQKSTNRFETEGGEKTNSTERIGYKMRNLSISKARDLIKRELGISAASLAAPPEMNGNPEYPWYIMTSGTLLVEVRTNDVNQGKYTDKMIALSVDHGNSSKGVTEYFYGDTLEYAEPYTDWQNREDFCERMEDPQSDSMLRRLKREAQDDSWQHFHGQNTQVEQVEKQEYSGKFKIRFFQPDGRLFRETEPFSMESLRTHVRRAQIEIIGEHVRNDLSDIKNIKTAGFSVMQWDEQVESWVDYIPDGRPMVYDTGLRSDGKVHPSCKRELPDHIPDGVSRENTADLKDEIKDLPEEIGPEMTL